MHAAKSIGWSSLYPLLTELADATCDDEYDWIWWDVMRFLQAFQALHVFLGELLLICSKVVILGTGQINNPVSLCPAALLVVAAAGAFVRVLSCIIACCSSLHLSIKQAMLLIGTNCYCKLRACIVCALRAVSWVY